jgi:hypothetical protein
MQVAEMSFANKESKDGLINGSPWRRKLVEAIDGIHGPG